MDYVNNKEKRLNICLNGLWEFAPGDGELGEIPNHWENTRIVVPSPWNINSFAAPEEIQSLKEKHVIRGGDYNLFPQYPKEWEEAKSGWYKTAFSVPEEWHGKKIKLKFNAVHFYSEYYINGVMVASDADGFLPFEFDIGNVVSYGDENILVVGVKKIDMFKVKLVDGVEKEKFVHPTGSFWGGHIAGIWQDVFLNVYPPDTVDEVFIQTDIVNRILNVQATLLGYSTLLTLEYILKKYKGNFEYRLGEQVVEPYEKNPVFTYDYSELYEAIKLWWPNSPELYILTINIKKGDKIVDSKDIRFGFRTFKINGNKFVLNGVPINLRNDSWHYMGFAYQTEEYARSWYKMARDAHVNCIRLHAQVYPEFFLDIADEEGMLIIDESSIWASHCKMHYSSEFFENCEKHIDRLVKRDRNHPSVIIWSIENECIPAYRVHGDSGVKDEDELNAKIYLLAEHVQRLDPTRPTSADGSWDLGGRMGIVSLHYTTREKTIKTDKPITIGEMGSMYYSSPDCVCNVHGGTTYLSFEERLEAIGQEAFECLKEHRKWAAQVCIFNLVWYGLYPLPIRERMLTYDAYNTPGIKPSKIGPYISTLNAGFDDNLPEYIPNPVFEWVKKAFIPERFFFEGDRLRYYSRSIASRNISVFNDSTESREYVLSWRLLSNEVRSSGGRITVQIPPAEYKEIVIEFKLPEVIHIEEYIFEVDMMIGDALIFSDIGTIKVYNPASLVSQIGLNEGVIAFVGWTELISRYFDEKKFKLYRVGQLKYESLIYILLEPIDQGTYDNLLKKGKKIIDLSLDGPYFKRLSWQNPVEKAFFNISNELLTDGIDEQDLYSWEKGLMASSSLNDYINATVRNLLVTGKGTPLISELCLQGTQVIISALNLIDYIEKEPAALKLLVNLINYLYNSRAVSICEAVLISKQGSELANLLTNMGVSYKLIDAEDNAKIRGLTGQPVIIADGKQKLDFIDQLTYENADRLIILGLTNDNVPMSLKGCLNVVGAPLNQLVKEEEDEITAGIHPGDMYGLEAGNEVLMTDKPIFIRDSDKVIGLLKNSDTNWIYWNSQGEDKKTAAILRNEKENRLDLYGLVKTKVNGINVYISQIGLDYSNYKLKKLACTLLGNLGVEIKLRDIDEFDAILNEGIYDNGIKKLLVLGPVTGINGEEVHPALNKSEKDVYWKLMQNDELSMKGDYLYGFYVFSPSDRTDLLLNPDLTGIEVNSKFDKKLYLNGNLISTRTLISVNALKLRAGWNEIVVYENRSDERSEHLEIIFKRKDDRDLDLTFSLDVSANNSIPCDRWSIDSNYNMAECLNSIKGKGILWDSVESQVKGMYFSLDLGEIQTVSKLQFSSKVIKLDHIQWNTPRSFTVFISENGVSWKAMYTVGNESSLTLVDGKLIINFNPCSTRFIKFRIDDVANKRLMISELRVFTPSIQIKGG